MPTYVYEVINDDGSAGETFEVFQKMTDAPLTALQILKQEDPKSLNRTSTVD